MMTVLLPRQLALKKLTLSTLKAAGISTKPTPGQGRRAGRGVGEGAEEEGEGHLLLHVLPEAGEDAAKHEGPHFRGQRMIGDLTMATGTVKWFNTTKGFGFIAPDTGGKDVFLHISALERAGMTTLNDDQKVTFDVEAGRDGRESATNIALA